MTTKKSITILPETRDAVLCVRFHETVTAEDYLEYFERSLEQIYNAFGYVSVLIHFDESFSGWTKEAADLSFRCISTYAPKAKKIGYVNAPDSRMLLMKMLAPRTKAEVRFFDTSQESDALKWIES